MALEELALDRDLPPSSVEARICSFECTFCATCAETFPGGNCPNCGGNLVSRPIRPDALLARHPASTARIFNARCHEQPENRPDS
ncbi:DUF1272 domain-containing protein [Rhizobiaceae bacterium BDR2-2]|uniref:DUF1272 domain-containing protein n=1 Tax=Ectorhizobium quercum TaxID=2965071 RepID=A0AAE3N2S4_9HYPH|nr:DUF1272 domain-containing protein [Ectorhizobium quercum]MCX8999111.1 DUF1272 domain-containing protein [Ectorhizobium quercum]